MPKWGLLGCVVLLCTLTACSLAADEERKVDVGVVCLRLGTVGERRHIARQLAQDLLARADKLMYEAKSERSAQVSRVQVRVENGELVELAPDEFLEHEHAAVLK